MRDGGWMKLATCVARAHPRRVLESAHRAGLLLAPPRDGEDIRLAPASYLACFASEYADYRRWGLGAKRYLGLDLG